MKRDFLKELGLEDSVVEKIMSEHGKTVNGLQQELTTLTEGNNTLQTQLGELSSHLDESKNYKEQSEKTIQDLTTRVKTYELDNMKTRIALTNGLPYELASRLSGDDEDGILKDAISLTKLLRLQEVDAPLKNVETDVNDDPYRSLIQNLEGEK